MKKSTLIISILLLPFMLSGCAGRMSEGDSSVSRQASDTSPAEISAEPPVSDVRMFTARDLRDEYDKSRAITIELMGSTARASSDSVRISGSTVQICEEAVYIISGSLDDGMLIVDTADSAKPQLVFDGVDINSTGSAALYILEADKVIITLAEGSENRLSNGGSFTAIDESNIDAALFSKQDLTINGSGSLEVSSPAGHGIVSKDDLVLTGGKIRVSAASHGMSANDSVRITHTELNILAGKDGLHSDNSDDSSLGFVYISDGSIKIQAEGDGISASSHVNIAGGDFEITAGGGSENAEKKSSGGWGQFPGGRGGPGSYNTQPSYDTNTEQSGSMKGIKADGELLISGGSLSINSADDAIHSDSSVSIEGGSFDIATGDDAFHAEDTLTVNSGKISVSESYEGLEALHVEVNGGEISIVSDDDGINAAGGTDSSGTSGGRDGNFGGPGPMHWGNSDGSIAIYGGAIYIRASGDGIDANGTLEITGGSTVVTGPSQGDTTVLDYDLSALITGGSFIGTGSTMMAQTFSSSTQGVLSLSVGNQAADTEITLTDSAGNLIFRHSPELPYQIVILSIPQMISGESYTITVGSLSGVFEAS